MNDRRDRICIDSLELSAQLGITEDERALPQRVTLSLTFEPEREFSGLQDDIRQTVDYVRVCEAARTIARECPRHLLETLGEEIARGLLAAFPIRTLQLELRKYVVPETAFVAVQLARTRGSA
jgi:dihydroneopterin aldolase